MYFLMFIVKQDVESHCVGAGSPASSGRMTSEAHVALQSLSALGAAVQLFSGVWSGYWSVAMPSRMHSFYHIAKVSPKEQVS